jgi:hypothetical protein
MHFIFEVAIYERSFMLKNAINVKSLSFYENRFLKLGPINNRSILNFLVMLRKQLLELDIKIEYYLLIIIENNFLLFKSKL